MDTMDIAAEFRAAAARKQLSQRAIATQLGVTPTWVNRRFSGATELTVDEFLRLCRLLDLDARTLLPPTTAAAV